MQHLWRIFVNFLEADDKCPRLRRAGVCRACPQLVAGFGAKKRSPYKGASTGMASSQVMRPS